MAQPNTKTPAMVLQEFTVKNGLSPPQYDLVMSKTGTHDNEFHYNVNVANISARGFGRSKQVAKHDAATKALEILSKHGVFDSGGTPVQQFDAQSHRNESDSIFQPVVNFIGTLKDLCFTNKLPYPIFDEISDVGPPHCREFTYECKISSITTQATAKTKKQAKQLAAKSMLEKIKDTCPELIEQIETEANTLTEKESETIGKYNELVSSLGVMPNRTVTVEEFTHTLKKIMNEKNLTIENFTDQFIKRDKEGLDFICQCLEIKFEISSFQDKPPMACASFGIETPLTVISVGTSYENAVDNLIQEVYLVLDVYMNIPDI